MKVISAETAIGSLKFFGQSLNTRHDFHISINSDSKDLDYLVFFDSRGISKQFNNSLVDLLIRTIRDYKYLAICRPLAITTWATLVNFMRYNRIAPKVIITNMGFVDFTPKKRSILHDALAQAQHCLKNKCRSRFIEHYKTADNKILNLYVIDYPKEYKKNIQECLLQSRCVAIKTPLVCKSLRLERSRPASFYTQIQQANCFVDSLGCKTTIDLGHFDNSLTYDGVHWTTKGNQLIMKRLKEVL